jgi:hypothetical protein
MPLQGVVWVLNRVALGEIDRIVAGHSSRSFNEVYQDWYRRLP